MLDFALPTDDHDPVHLSLPRSNLRPAAPHSHVHLGPGPRHFPQMRPHTPGSKKNFNQSNYKAGVSDSYLLEGHIIREKCSADRRLTGKKLAIRNKHKLHVYNKIFNFLVLTETRARNFDNLACFFHKSNLWMRINLKVFAPGSRKKIVSPRDFSCAPLL
jgi:hypothetical protein